MQSRHRAATLSVEDRHKIAIERANGATLISLCKKWGFCEHFIRSCIRFPDGPTAVLPSNENGEQWLPIPDYEGWYSASNAGRIRRDRSHIGTRAGYILKPKVERNGYLRLMLVKQGERKSHSVHRLVAAAFLGACPDAHSVNHKSGDKTDNRPVNLEYVTVAENNRHAFRTGLNLARRGEAKPSAKLTEATVREMRQLFGKIRTSDLAKRFGVTPSSVCDIKHGRTWQHVV